MNLRPKICMKFWFDVVDKIKNAINDIIFVVLNLHTHAVKLLRCLLVYSCLEINFSLLLKEKVFHNNT